MSLPPDKPSARSGERLPAAGPFPPELVPEDLGINMSFFSLSFPVPKVFDF